MSLDIQFIWTAFQEIIRALPLTLTLTIVPLFIGFWLGLATALIRIYRVRGLTFIANAYVSFLRGTPIIMHIMLIYFGLPMLIDAIADYFHWSSSSHLIPISYFVITALSLSAGAYLSEILRSGIIGVSKGQIEAAYSVGLTTFQALRRIVIPQALAHALPNFTNVTIGFLHTTSIAFFVSQKELTGAANIVASFNLRFLEAIIAAGILYWALTIIIEAMSVFIEKYVNPNRKGANQL